MHGRTRRRFELRRCRVDAELRAIPVHQPQHERVAADERVLRQRVPVFPQHRRHSHRAFDQRHVARLAAPLLLEERAVAPLLVVHLLGQRTDRAPVGTQGFGDERVARRTELRFADVLPRRLLESARRVHDATASGVDLERAERPAHAVRERRGDTEVAVEAVARAEPVGSDLMADRARDAVGGQSAERRLTGAPGDGQVREHLALAARGARDLLRRRHVARGALVLDVGRPRRVVESLAAHAGMEVRVARRVGHHGAAPARADRHVLAGRRHEVVVADDAVARWREHGVVGGRGRSAAPQAPAAPSATGVVHTITASQPADARNAARVVLVISRT